MATRTRCSPAQLALAWLIAKGKDIVPIPGTKRVKYVEENAGAASVELTKADIEELESTFTRDAAAGDRYTESMGRLVDRVWLVGGQLSTYIRRAVGRLLPPSALCEAAPHHRR
jgi:hypothetical protein